jgi:hypothetical protein
LKKTNKTPTKIQRKKGIVQKLDKKEKKKHNIDVLKIGWRKRCLLIKKE